MVTSVPPASLTDNGDDSGSMSSAQLNCEKYMENSASTPYASNHEAPLASQPTAQHISTQITQATGALLLHSLAMKLDWLELQSLTYWILHLHMPAGTTHPGYRSLHCLFNTSGLRSHEEVEHTLCRGCGELINEVSSRNAVECMHARSIKFYEIPLDIEIQALFKG